jgi:hypothetical protein
MILYFCKQECFGTSARSSLGVERFNCVGKHANRTENPRQMEMERILLCVGGERDREENKKEGYLIHRHSQKDAPSTKTQTSHTFLENKKREERREKREERERREKRE